MLKPIARFIVALGVLLLFGSTAIAADADQTSAIAATVVAQTSLAPLTAESLTTALAQPLFPTTAPKGPNPAGKALRYGMYASFAALQALDAHSTLKAIQAGGHEANPFMRAFASKPAALIAVKAGTAAATMMFVEKLSKRNPIASFVVMTALNSAYATVVAHNYRVAAR
jgi:hypothetical protein